MAMAPTRAGMIPTVATIESDHAPPLRNCVSCGPKKPTALPAVAARVENDAGIESGLGQAEQESQRVETGRAAHEHHGGGDDPPGQHDSGNPPTRPHSLHDQVAGHLEQEVSDEEHAGAETVDDVAQAQ